ncbi:MAG: hypothetical protein UT24_C0012G0107 [Candidatus Woesebacteria bacterium GW2011_GWB1_39_12]|uniref:Uncharacterized protein n=1 Tax=Candidatus Woesebacteria bacterium GW2011_GWB1_39_12 TaxID=1618574 RepID=A0A0G0PQP3_9BACT|nr:MAG: hypothetical protein UT24_C0012G0107 [Candidatus Woesebacteria bacterium GW2011_GWB1_39_12]
MSEDPQPINTEFSAAEVHSKVEELSGMGKEQVALHVLEVEFENMKLRRQAYYDTALTFLLNKTGLIEELDAIEVSSEKSVQVEGEQRGSSDIGYIVADAVDLHLVNNTYGQDAGDLYLLDIASTASLIARRENDLVTTVKIPSSASRPGIAARGGARSDEFVVVNSGVDREGLDERVGIWERILKERETEAQKRYPGIKYSLSIVKTLRRPGEKVTDGFVRAMSSLHIAKEERKSREGQDQTKDELPAGGIWV